MIGSTCLFSFNGRRQHSGLLRLARIGWLAGKDHPLNARQPRIVEKRLPEGKYLEPVLGTFGQQFEKELLSLRILLTPTELLRIEGRHEARWETLGKNRAQRPGAVHDRFWSLSCKCNLGSLEFKL